MVCGDLYTTRNCVLMSQGGEVPTKYSGRRGFSQGYHYDEWVPLRQTISGAASSSCRADGAQSRSLLMPADYPPGELRLTDLRSPDQTRSISGSTELTPSSRYRQDVYRACSRTETVRPSIQETHPGAERVGRPWYRCGARPDQELRNDQGAVLVSRASTLPTASLATTMTWTQALLC
jgi:hypothetical protein